MPTVASLVIQTRQRLMGSIVEHVNVLGTAIADKVATTVVLADDVAGISRGTVIEIGAEEMYVRTVDPTTKTLTVLRGWNGTAASSHTAGKPVWIAPSFPASQLTQAVIDEVAALNGTSLYSFETVQFSLDGTTQLFELETSRPVAYIHRAWFQNQNSHRPADVELRRDVDPDVFGSGTAIQVLGGGLRGDTLRVTLARHFGVPRSASDDVESASIGLTPAITPVIPVGAAHRMILSKEAQRLNPDASHGSRRAEEVQPGSIAFLGRALQRQKEDLLEQALELQYAQYPPRRRGEGR